jgi:hypothetical protein
MARAKFSKIWGWDPGSEIRDPEKTYSGSRIQGSKRPRIRIRNTADKLINAALLIRMFIPDQDPDKTGVEKFTKNFSNNSILES